MFKIRSKATLSPCHVLLPVLDLAVAVVVVVVVFLLLLLLLLHLLRFTKGISSPLNTSLASHNITFEAQFHFFLLSQVKVF